MLAIRGVSGTAEVIIYDTSMGFAIRPMKGSDKSFFTPFQAEVLYKLLQGRSGNQLDHSIDFKYLPDADDEKEYHRSGHYISKAADLFIEGVK